MREKFVSDDSKFKGKSILSVIYNLIFVAIIYAIWRKMNTFTKSSCIG